MHLLDIAILQLTRGNTTAGDLLILNKFADHRKNIVEIGTAYGIGAMILHSQGSPVTTIDTHEFYLNNFSSTPENKANKISVYLDYFSNGEISTYLNNSLDAAKGFDNNSIDLLFIDGDHHYNAVCKDYEAWFPKVEKNGVIIFHDVSEDNDQVLGAWNDLIINRDIPNRKVRELIQDVSPLKTVCKVIEKL